MNKKLVVGAVTMMGTLALAGSALAQTSAKDEVKDDKSETKLAPATHALELTIGTGYQQGFGKFASNRPSLTDVADAGGAMQVGLGYRILPQLTLGIYGSGAAFSRGDQVDSTARLYSAAAGVQADWHFLPGGQEFDPWLSLGGGWRGYWVDTDSGTTSIQGLELAKLQIGLDYRIDQAVSISPVLGADLSTFLTQSTADSGGFTNIAKPNVNTFVFAGVMGRFDIPIEARQSQVAIR